MTIDKILMKEESELFEAIKRAQKTNKEISQTEVISAYQEGQRIYKNSKVLDGYSPKVLMSKHEFSMMYAIGYMSLKNRR